MVVCKGDSDPAVPELRNERPTGSLRFRKRGVGGRSMLSAKQALWTFGCRMWCVHVYLYVCNHMQAWLQCAARCGRLAGLGAERTSAYFPAQSPPTPHATPRSAHSTLCSLRSRPQSAEVREADEFGIKSVTLPVCLCLCGACPGSLPSLISRSIRESELGPGSGIRGPSAWVGGV